MFRPKPADMRPRRTKRPGAEWRVQSLDEAHEFWHFLFSRAPNASIVQADEG